jgi:hypothetical protein
MSSEKQVDDENETVASSTEKNDDQDDDKSKASDSDNDDTSSNASSEYEVVSLNKIQLMETFLLNFFKEKILSKRRRRRGGYEYYIKWVGYDDSANEWIPESSLNCPDRLAEFRREEAQKRKRSQREKSRSQKRRRNNNNNSRLKKRRVNKVIDDDDEEENEEEQEEEEEPAKSVESSNSSSTNSDKNQKTNSITYGVEKGYKVQAILGINRTQGVELHYLAHYKSPTIFEDNMELLPSSIAKKYCEDEIIQFYETRITWNDRLND